MDHYLQITTKCNMACEHCCFNCGGDQPYEHMSMATLKKAFKFMYALAPGDTINIGGGEPTVHPDFWNMFGAIMEFAAKSEARVFMVTNGKLQFRAMALSMLSASESEDGFRIELSADSFHERIPSMVTDTFKRNNCYVRDNNYYSSYIESGRARETSAYGKGAHMFEHPDSDNTSCVCDAVFISPNGDIRQCGCEGRWNLNYDWEPTPVLGNVNGVWPSKEKLLNEDQEHIGCWRGMPEVKLPASGG